MNDETPDEDSFGPDRTWSVTIEPDDRYRLPPDQFTPQERWVWARVLAGQNADLDLFHQEAKFAVGATTETDGERPYALTLWREVEELGEGGNADCPPCLDPFCEHDPGERPWGRNEDRSRLKDWRDWKPLKRQRVDSSNPGADQNLQEPLRPIARRWPAWQTLSVGFLRRVLTAQGQQSPLDDQLSILRDYQFAKICHARVVEEFNLANVVVEIEAIFENCQFEHGFNFDNTDCKRGVRLRECGVFRRPTDDSKSKGKYEDASRLCDIAIGGTLNLERSYFAHGLIAENMAVAGGVNMANAVFMGPVRLRETQAAGRLIIEGSHFDSTFNAVGLNVGGRLSATACHFRFAMNLTRAAINQGVDFDRSHFDGIVLLPGAAIEGSAEFKSCVFKNSIRAAGLYVEDRLFFANAEFVQTAGENTQIGNFHRAEIGEGVSFQNANIEFDLSFVNTQIGVDFTLIGAFVNAEIDLSRCILGKDFTLEGMRSDFVNLSELGLIAIFDPKNRRVRHYLEGDFQSENHTETLISATLRQMVANPDSYATQDILHYRDPKARFFRETYRVVSWGPRANLVLRDAKVEQLVCRIFAWKKGDSPDDRTQNRFTRFDLSGFHYERFADLELQNKGGQAGKPRPTSMATNKSKDLIAWIRAGLPKDERIIPGPFEVASKALREAGFDDKANDMLFARGVYRFHKAPFFRSGRFPFTLPKIQWALFWLFLGFGYRIYSRAILTLVIIVVAYAGVGFVLSGSGFVDSKANLIDWMGYSFDNALFLLEQNAGADGQSDTINAAVNNQPWVQRLFDTQRLAIFSSLFVAFAAATGWARRLGQE